ncbi:MAG: hypothetical protein L0387_38535 [Acidobacteria bacterium]|nr:hypothetical protein [Acidobacteriota bacterium]MCI0722750.1 hypothetical protein [Acidobacteriota bacterium]
MLPRIEPLVDTIRLYNNFARMGTHQGRLTVDLEVNPSPLIKWEFEVLGDAVVQSGMLTRACPIEGYRVKIDHPAATSDFHDFEAPLERLAGVSREFIFGSLDNEIHSVCFYIANARFQSRNVVGQKRIEKILRIEKEEIDDGDEGRVIDAELMNGWYVRIETRRKALDWLKERKSNVGTRTTTLGVLQSRMPPDMKFTDYPMLPLRTAVGYVETLCILLSFVNGGCLGPIYIEGVRYPIGPQKLACPDAVAFAYKTTPVELLGQSWLAMDSDLEAYINCFPTLFRMMSSEAWKEGLGVVLAWYFQAIQPEHSHSPRKQWPIVANALGTALERLTYTILVLEEDDPSQRTKLETLFSRGGTYKKFWTLNGVTRTAKRLETMLERIGLTRNRGCWDTKEVSSFLEVRNQATHPKKGSMEDARIPGCLALATQWVEEILLWRLGYRDKYWSRTDDGWQSTLPRYDLSTRNPNW